MVRARVTLEDLLPEMVGEIMLHLDSFSFTTFSCTNQRHYQLSRKHPNHGYNMEIYEIGSREYFERCELPHFIWHAVANGHFRFLQAHQVVKMATADCAWYGGPEIWRTFANNGARLGALVGSRHFATDRDGRVEQRLEFLQWAIRELDSTLDRLKPLGFCSWLFFRHAGDDSFISNRIRREAKYRALLRNYLGRPYLDAHIRFYKAIAAGRWDTVTLIEEVTSERLENYPHSFTADLWFEVAFTAPRPEEELAKLVPLLERSCIGTEFVALNFNSNMAAKLTVERYKLACRTFTAAFGERAKQALRSLQALLLEDIISQCHDTELFDAVCADYGGCIKDWPARFFNDRDEIRLRDLPLFKRLLAIDRAAWDDRKSDFTDIAETINSINILAAPPSEISTEARLRFIQRFLAAAGTSDPRIDEAVAGKLKSFI